MNLIGYMCYVLGFLSLFTTIDAINSRYKQNDPDFYDALSSEDVSKIKRPFCNAFTGCGKKRSFYSENTIENQEKTNEKIRIPLPIYRAILRAAGREIRQNFDRESRDASTGIDESYYTYRDNEIPRLERYRS